MIENFCLLVGKGRSPHINQTFLFCGHFLLDTNMILSLKSTLIILYHTDINYDCQDKPRVSVSVSSDCDTRIMKRFESDLSED